MTDRISKEDRSLIMSHNRPKNTSIEKKVFGILREKSIHFQRHYKKVAGTPDVAFPRRKIAIFIDGDFWHGYRYPAWKHKLHSDFWRKKIERNRQRDKNTFRKLRRKGWLVLRIWEHEIQKDLDKCLTDILALLRSNP